MKICVDPGHGMSNRQTGIYDPGATHVESGSLIKVTKMRDRKIKRRTDLAVLKFGGVAILIELGFIANDQDRTKLLNAQLRDAITRTIAKVVIDDLAQA